MKIEISHDTLAKTVYDRASLKDKRRLQAINVFKLKYSLYQQDSVYLNKHDLNLIEPFEEQLVLTRNEQQFLTRSKLLARKRMIALGVGSIVIFFILCAFLMSYVSAHDKLKNALIELEDQTKKTEIALDSVSQLANHLLTQDSIQRSLRNKIQDREGVINMTNSELQDVLNELQMVNDELKIANKKLEEQRKALRLERDRLRSDKLNLTEKLKDHDKIKTELTVVGQSQQLSQKAHELLNQTDNPTETQYKEAFKLARAAWEMSPKNSQAMDVLNDINNKKLPPSNGGFLSKNRPKYTYSYPKIRDIIQKLDQRYKYGKLSDTEVNRRLR